MAWDFLRRFLKLMGSKFVSKMAPRLLIFQYYDRVNLELEEQKKRFRVLFQKSQAELVLYQMLTHKPQFKIGMSSVLDDSQGTSEEVSILEIHGNQDFFDGRTVSSHYEGHESSEVDFIELQRYQHAEMRVWCRTCDGSTPYQQQTQLSNHSLSKNYNYQQTAWKEQMLKQDEGGLFLGHFAWFLEDYQHFYGIFPEPFYLDFQNNSDNQIYFPFVQGGII